MDLFGSHEAFDRWFDETLGSPTEVQRAAWPAIRTGGHALVTAATGQGKTLAAWRPLVERICEHSRGPQRVRAIHVAPLKALARDITHNLQPLLDRAGEVVGRPVTIALRCGDSSAADRARHKRRPPHILSTTPESLFVLLGSAGGRRLLRGVEAVVVDELHALIGCKRGAHLALTLARLDRLVGSPVQRIGLSATAHPGRRLADFLTGGAACEIIAPGGVGPVDLRVELPEMRLGPFPNSVHWQQIHQRVAGLAGANGDWGNGLEVPGLAELARNDGGDCVQNHEKAPLRSLLAFCQTRAQVERSAAALDQMLSEAGMPGQVGAHHGSLDTSHREGIEARFKRGDLRILVSSASLELGLDLGHVDRVCQLGVPGSANLVRQRAGRSRHRPGRTPCMHLFPLTVNQLIEAQALRDRLNAGVIEASTAPDAALDVLTQQLAAMAASGVDDPEEMLSVVRAAAPYRSIGAETISRLLALLTDAPGELPSEQTTRLLVRDGGDRFRACAQADRLVLTNAGTIPEFFEYEVVRADTGERVGTLDEEFAFESSPGQVVQLGRRSWRVLRVLTGEVRVEPVDADAVELPFWFGEGPGRTPEMAAAMLDTIARCEPAGLDPQCARMLSESKALLGALPSSDRLVIERFPDPNGDRHVVLHTFAGARINRAWGLALRKRFCRQFNFELQAAATDDGILVSLGVTSRFEPAEVARFVRSHNVADVLTQALLDTPLFVTRFRWAANNALVLLKSDLGGRVPPQRQRSQAENLIACVFPDQLACVENLSGPREVPDHPLVQQALADCLNDYMDLAGLESLLSRIESGAVQVHAVDIAEPSPLAEALIHAPRYSYLDEAAAEERRTRNFERASGRRERGSAIRRSSPRPVGLQTTPVAAPRRRGRGLPSTADALERLLIESGFLTATEGEAGAWLDPPVPAGGWTRCFSQLVRERRAVSVGIREAGPRLWVATGRLGQLLVLQPRALVRPWISPALIPHAGGNRDEAMADLLAARRRFEGDRAATTLERLRDFAGGPIAEAG